MTFACSLLFDDYLMSGGQLIVYLTDLLLITAALAIKVQFEISQLFTLEVQFLLECLEIILCVVI